MPTREEMLARGQEELKRYGGKPSYESTLGEVPEYLRDIQDYRPHPKYKRYMIFDKQTGEFLIDKPAPMESGAEFDMPRAIPVNNPVMRAERYTDADMERTTPVNNPVMRAERSTDADMELITPPRPQNVKKTIEDLRGATDFLKVLSNREKMNKRTKR